MTTKDECWRVSEPFASRPTHFRQIFAQNGWRFKVYEILYGDEPLDWDQYQNAIDLASKELPQPAITEQRPGVGFIICHQGRGWHYLVVCWWDNENELSIDVWVQKIAEQNKWRKATKGRSICVWDLEVIWIERNSYIDVVLSKPESADLDAYLNSRLNIDV